MGKLDDFAAAFTQTFSKTKPEEMAVKPVGYKGTNLREMSRLGIILTKEQQAAIINKRAKTDEEIGSILGKDVMNKVEEARKNYSK